MDHIGIDVHKRESQICIHTERGQVIEPRIRTTRERFAASGRERPRPNPLEATTETEWVARCLEALGHEVIVADPNFGRCMRRGVGRSRPIGAMPATLGGVRLGAYRPAHRSSRRPRSARGARGPRGPGAYPSEVRCAGAGVGRREGTARAGTRPGLCASAGAGLPAVQVRIEPLLNSMTPLTRSRPPFDRLAEVVATTRSSNGCGPCRHRTGHRDTFVAVLDTSRVSAPPRRCTPIWVSCPARRARGSSARGRITKAGNARLGCSSSRLGILRSEHDDTAPERWALRMALRRGKRIAPWRWRESSRGSSTRCGGTAANSDSRPRRTAVAA